MEERNLLSPRREVLTVHLDFPGTRDRHGRLAALGNARAIESWHGQRTVSSDRVGVSTTLFSEVHGASERAPSKCSAARNGAYARTHQRGHFPIMQSA